MQLPPQRNDRPVMERSHVRVRSGWIPDAVIVLVALIVPLALTALLGHALSEQDRTPSAMASSLELATTSMTPEATLFAKEGNVVTPEEDHIGIEVNIAKCFSGRPIDATSHSIPLTPSSLSSRFQDWEPRLSENLVQLLDNRTACPKDAFNSVSIGGCIS